MSAWGLGPFDNDDALDWLGDFLESPDRGLVWVPLGTSKPARLRRALRRPYLSKYLDMGHTERAIVAAEVIAAACGSPSDEAPDELCDWAQRRVLKLDRLRRPAMRVATYLRDAPAYRRLFLDDNDYPEWQGHVDDLIKRLS
ncbi:hypothetical protein MNBD_PLANCTO03-210 [hydrothermal vent metagenome]|uniref:DUF4259 domain-containing protein n=1 Tax=hydrothermal vent metagenome TaxID=652676 RepID=A0A3B1DL05_9ZZZZ